MTQRPVVYCDLCNAELSSPAELVRVGRSAGCVYYGSRSDAQFVGWECHGEIDVCPECSELPDLEQRINRMYEDGESAEAKS